MSELTGLISQLKELIDSNRHAIDEYLIKHYDGKNNTTILIINWLEEHAAPKRHQGDYLLGAIYYEETSDLYKLLCL